MLQTPAGYSHFSEHLHSIRLATLWDHLFLPYCRPHSQVERRLEKLLGSAYLPLPTDEQIAAYFASEILREKEDVYIPPEVRRRARRRQRQSAVLRVPKRAIEF